MGNIFDEGESPRKKEISHTLRCQMKGSEKIQESRLIRIPTSLIMTRYAFHQITWQDKVSILSPSISSIYSSALADRFLTLVCVSFFHREFPFLIHRQHKLVSSPLYLMKPWSHYTGLSCGTVHKGWTDWRLIANSQVWNIIIVYLNMNMIGMWFIWR